MHIGMRVALKSTQTWRENEFAINIVETLYKYCGSINCELLAFKTNPSEK